VLGADEAMTILQHRCAPLHVSDAIDAPSETETEAKIVGRPVAGCAPEQHLPAAIAFADYDQRDACM
jgi:hypothetical protein